MAPPLGQCRSPQQKLLAQQKRIFRSLQFEVNRILGPPPKSILRYRNEYEDDFRLLPGRLELVSKAELIDEMRNADISLVADFHTFSQSQRTAIRLIREAVRSGENWVIGMEMIPSHYQAGIEAYLAGKISTRKFLKQIQYDSIWGFPWENYSPIFEFARENQVKIKGLNRPSEIALGFTSDAHELLKRDQWAAGILADLFTAREKGPRVIVLYGELHLGRQHLPKQIQWVSKKHLGEPLKVVTIHQNNDRLYWKVAEQGKEVHAQVIQLKNNSYCVLSGTPWAKLQSLVNWFEHEAQGGEEADYLSVIKDYGETIATLLGIEPPSFETLSLHTIDDADFLDLSSYAGKFNRREISLIRFHVTHNIRFYLPEEQLAYLGSPSQNGAAEMASIHLLVSVSRPFIECRRFTGRSLEDLFRWILIWSFGFFGSLLVNPRRKCDLPRDHLRRILELKRGKPQLFAAERSARENTLKMHKSILKRGKRDLGSLLRGNDYASACSWMVSARYLGQILGRTLYQGIIDGKVDLRWVTDHYFPSGSAEHNPPDKFEQTCLKLFSSLSRVSVPVSKVESI